MSFTVAQLNAIEAAIGTGQLEVEYDGKRVKYRSMGELMKARATIRAELVAQGLVTDTGRSNRGPSSLAVFCRD